MKAPSRSPVDIAADALSSWNSRRARAAAREDVERNLSDECECGRPKKNYAFTCERCRFLDGGCSLEVKLIECMRATNVPVTIVELAEYSGSARRAVHRSVTKLVRSGRVSAIEMMITVAHTVFDHGVRETGRTAMGYRLNG
jgi:CRP-like cAMP-binding protein